MEEFMFSAELSALAGEENEDSPKFNRIITLESKEFSCPLFLDPFIPESEENIS